jgi:hypothetical protein
MKISNLIIKGKEYSLRSFKYSHAQYLLALSELAVKAQLVIGLYVMKNIKLQLQVFYHIYFVLIDYLKDEKILIILFLYNLKISIYFNLYIMIIHIHVYF